MTVVAPLAPAPADTGTAPGPLAPVRRWGAELALVAAALAYGLGQLPMLRVALGWDESIYFSQVTPHEPAAFFSAPRARGISWLAAPLADVTADVRALRVYLLVLSAVALYGAFRVWFRVLPPAAVVAAAGAFASLWITRFYGAQLMPNLWVAFGVVLAVGGFARVAGNRRDVAGLVALPAGLALAALMRPTDAAWVTAALLLCALAVRGWRHNLVLPGLTVSGAVLGAVPWVVEAEARFGGVGARLREGSAIQGGLGWYPHLFGQHLRTLDGPLLCRPCMPPASRPFDTVWLLAIPLALVVLAAARVLLRERVPAGVVVAGISGAAVAVPYLLMVGYSAPRFLLPALGLLALPVGLAAQVCVTLGAEGAARVWRGGSTAAVLALAVLAVVQVAAQQGVYARLVAGSARSTGVYVEVAAQLRRDGVRAPCVVSGLRSPQIAFYAGCAPRNVGGHDASITPDGLRDLAGREPVVAVVEPDRPAPHYVRLWTRKDILVPGRSGVWRVFTPPRANPARVGGRDSAGS